MLRAALPRQRPALVRLIKRYQTTTASTSTATPVPVTPSAPGLAKPASPDVPKPPTLPPDPKEVSSAPPPPPPPPQRPKKKGRFRRFLFWSTALLGISYAGGVYYALVSDNFHDFFTEYVPFGEEAVLYFEEREFQRRFPNRATSESRLYPQTSGENKVQVSRQSGVSARVASEEKPKPAPKKEEPKSKAPTAPKSSKPVAGEPAKPKETPKKETTPAKSTAPAKTTEPAKPIPQIDNLKIDNAADPVVQSISKILNDVIQVVNADQASSKYSSTISKAKDDVQKLAADIAQYHALATKEANDKYIKSQQEFDQGAQDLINRVQQQQKDQELRFREEYEAERERLAQAYEEKIRAELASAQKVSDQKLKNELLEQSVKLTDEFTTSVRDRVEKERSSRLSKLNQLAADVNQLEDLTSKWGAVVDRNLQTQHLLVAVEAVRASIESQDRPTPFVHELVALKEVGSNNPTIDAAIASIEPSSYQKGIPTNSQLIDRFRRVATEVRKASLLPEDAGAASHAASMVLSKVLFKKTGPAIGEDTESILTRTEALLEEGSLDEATREMNGLTGWSRVLSRDWLRDCRKTLEVRQALDVIATEARLQSLLVQ